jgi:hypothetical protein
MPERRHKRRTSGLKRIAHIPGFSDEQTTADELGLLTAPTLMLMRRWLPWSQRLPASRIYSVA